jgi:hypothetical protein
MAADLDDLEEESSSSLSPPLLPPPRSPLNQPELWMRVEEATREIIEQVHPTLVSEDRRRDVILYVQKLIRMTLGCEVNLNKTFSVCINIWIKTLNVGTLLESAMLFCILLSSLDAS